MKVCKTYIKPFESPRRSVKIKITLFSLRPGLGREELTKKSCFHLGDFNITDNISVCLLSADPTWPHWFIWFQSRSYLPIDGFKPWNICCHHFCELIYIKSCLEFIWILPQLFQNGDNVVNQYTIYRTANKQWQTLKYSSTTLWILNHFLIAFKVLVFIFTP